MSADRPARSPSPAASSQSKGEPQLDLLAYRVGPPEETTVVPAAARRRWMEDTSEHFANRCLPLLMANQAGWFILNTEELRVTWDGDDLPESLHIERLGATRPYVTRSHFGAGILTWRIPYLFRTPPGYNLLVRGPANWPKDGAYPLEGLVETDWAVSTFTMNWKITRPDTVVNFSRGEPICMIVPQRRGELESIRPRLADISSNHEVAGPFATWQESRRSFLRDLSAPGRGNDGGAQRSPWQKHYFQGIAEGGTPAQEHQRKLDLRPFDDSAALDAALVDKVRQLATAASYPIERFDDLASMLGGAGASVDFSGRTFRVGSLHRFLPEEFFPVVSEEDLLSKIRSLYRRP